MSLALSTVKIREEVYSVRVHDAYLYLGPSSSRIYTSRDVRFIEDDFTLNSTMHKDCVTLKSQQPMVHSVLTNIQDQPTTTDQGCSTTSINRSRFH